jgi:MFS family permease
MTRRAHGLHGWRAVLVWSLVALDLAALAIVSVFLPPMPDYPAIATAVFGSMVASFGIVGALIATREPRNPIGWILCVAATGVTISIVGDIVSYALGAAAGANPLAAVLIWSSSFVLIPSFALVVIFVPLVFPDGHLLSPRWRWLVGAAIVSLVVGSLPDAFHTGLLADRDIINPFGIAAFDGLGGIRIVTNLVAVVAFPLAVVSTVLRYRRGTDLERTQLRWFAASASITVAGFLLALTPIEALNSVGWFLAITSISLVPLSIGIAILRYRLYEIDRLISRTLAYALISGILLGVYGGGVILLSTLLETFTQGATIAVAASTLAAFAVFQPARRWAQRVVDRRFNRIRFDAEETSSAFSRRLRDQVDIGAVSADLAATVQAAIRPEAIGLWLRDPRP